MTLCSADRGCLCFGACFQLGLKRIPSVDCAHPSPYVVQSHLLLLLFDISTLLHSKRLGVVMCCTSRLLVCMGDLMIDEAVVAPDG